MAKLILSLVLTIEYRGYAFHDGIVRSGSESFYERWTLLRIGNGEHRWNNGYDTASMFQ